MNNEQFRRLVGADTPKPSPNSNGATPAPPRALALGSKQRSSIPMTPRAVGFSRSDFQRQLAERDQGERPQKKYKTSAPKGSKLARGYVDRAKTREEQEEDDRAVRLKALEEALKKEEIDQTTYDELRAQIAGGDLGSTHLVKGLDFKLLERIRRGEDVYGNKETPDDEAESEDVDDVFDQLEEAKIDAIEKEATSKKGQLATAATLKPGQKRSRAMILAEMKAEREAAKAKEESALGSKFKKIGAKKPGTRIERDDKGREVLIIVDEDGHEKRKVRKVQADTQSTAEADAKARSLMIPDKGAKPLGMDVPDIYKANPQEPEDDDVDIFDNVGDDYDPLAGLEEDSDDDDDADNPAKTTTEKEAAEDREAMPPPPRPASTADQRNYFKDSKSGLVSAQNLQGPSMSDPAIQAALKKAASLNSIPKPSDEDDEETRAKAERRRKMLQTDDRDAEDMDMGFGTSRFEDEADFDDTQVKLSQWGDADDDDDSQGGGGGKAKRKRGGKKRKGDVNNAADVMRVVESRKAAK
ncbi:hypothetical protein BJ170DRAFT_602384 [Xylariales sp. AK1849]|nr:hypothetical protein BJ170DRAFT_602384 [Xylariales sp. AK1849]